MIVKRLSKQAWDSYIPMFRDASYRQLSSYAAVAARRVGAKSELNGILQGQTLVGLADVRVRKVPLVPIGIAYVSYGPMTVRDGTFSAEKFSYCLDALREEYVERRRLLLRIIPPLGSGLSRDLQIQRLEACGFRLCAAQRPRETFIVDLARPLDAIRSGFEPEWRRDLNRAEKADISITRSTELGDFDRFEKILVDLMKQKQFTANEDVNFFKAVQPDTAPDQKLVLHLAWHGQELIAGHLGSFVGDTAVYLLGAANSKGRDLRASYLLQWAVIEYAQRLGNIYYDLGGVDQRQNPGVFRFKKRLNGRAVADVGPYEYATGTFRIGLLKVLETARDAIRGQSHIAGRVRRNRCAVVGAPSATTDKRWGSAGELL